MWFPFEERCLQWQHRDSLRVKCKFRKHELSVFREEEGKSYGSLEGGAINID